MKEHIKKDSIRIFVKKFWKQNLRWNPLFNKFSNFSSQWTKTLCQNNLNNITFFFTFFKGYRYNKLSVVTLYLLGARENKCQISVSSQSSLTISYVTSPIKLVGKICWERLALSHSVPSLLWWLWIARTGLGTRLVKFHKNCESTGKI